MNDDSSNKTSDSSYLSEGSDSETSGESDDDSEGGDQHNGLRNRGATQRNDPWTDDISTESPAPEPQ